SNRLSRSGPRSLGGTVRRLSRAEHVERASLLHSRCALERPSATGGCGRVSEVTHERADATPRPRARLPAGESRGFTPVRRESLDPPRRARGPDRIAWNVRTTWGRSRPEPPPLLPPLRIGRPTPQHS